MAAPPLTPALLVLEDGRAFRGRLFGADGGGGGEVVFNTSMAGYQEILTDPSYAGQIVVMTYPMIGNYGIAAEDSESRKAFLAGFVVKELSRIHSNWRSKIGLHDYLVEQGITGICDLDTRALVRHLRERGAMRGVIGTAGEGADSLAERARRLSPMEGADLASTVTTPDAYGWSDPSVSLDGRAAAANGGPFDVAVIDFGVKRNILRRLVDHGCKVRVLPAKTTVADILALKPDGVMLSNGPGDPDPVDYGIKAIEGLIGQVPIFAICLGHQLLGRAVGGKTFKLKFGHHGGNHPVMDLRTRKVEITSQNHGFAVDPDSLDDSKIELTHINLNDQTLEGLRLRDAPAFSVQYHPEAAPGPHDAGYLFDRFAAMMRDWHKDGG